MTREEAIERFNGIINAMSISIAQSKFYPSKAELNELCDMAIEALSAEAVQGEWVRCEGEIKDWGGDIVGYSYWYECDQCGSRPPRNEFATQEWLSNFCPNCGARMYKGGENG